MSHLFATTDLERTYRVNLNVIGVDGRPAVKSLVTILKEWCFAATVKRRLSIDSSVSSDESGILEGYLVAFLNIDEWVALSAKRTSPRRCP